MSGDTGRANSTPDDVQLLLLQINDKNGEGKSVYYTNAMLYAMEKGADVVNMSISVTSGQKSTNGEWDYAINKLYEAGIPLVASAGNEHGSVSAAYPACNAKTIAVSAVSESYELCDFSNTGNGIDFCAPGQGIAIANGTKKDGYAYADGTSEAAPHVAAAVEYIKLLHPGYGVQKVYSILKNNAKDLGTADKDEKFGWGMPVMDGYVAREVNKAGHIHAWTMEKDGNYACQKRTIHYICSCGEKDERTLPTYGTHEWDDGAAGNGTVTYTCKDCGHTKTVKDISPVLYGNARLDGRAVVLTDDKESQQGMAAYQAPLSGSKAFEVEMEYRSRPNKGAPADGIAVMFTSTPGTQPQSGGTGRSINLRGDKDMYAVVLDSFEDSGSCVKLVNQDADHVLAQSGVCGMTADGIWHTLLVKGEAGHVSVWIDGELWLEKEDVSLPSTAFVSVTASTGAYSSEQSVRMVNVRQ